MSLVKMDRWSCGNWVGPDDAGGIMNMILPHTRVFSHSGVTVSTRSTNVDRCLHCRPEATQTDTNITLCQTESDFGCLHRQNILFVIIKRHSMWLTGSAGWPAGSFHVTDAFNLSTQTCYCVVNMSFGCMSALIVFSLKPRIYEWIRSESAGFSLQRLGAK